jgi:hypothetical protein
MIEEAIVSQAGANAGLTALIGTNPVRLHPQMLPQDPLYPAVTYDCISSPREVLMGADPGLVTARWQFSAWSLNYQDVRDVAEQLRLAFERWRGTVGSVVVLDTLDWDAHDAPPELVNDVIVRQRISECRIIYRE